MFAGKYSLFNLMHQYNSNYDLIKSYLSGGDQHTPDSHIAGWAIGVFLTILALALAIFVWSVYAIIKYANYYVFRKATRRGL